MENSLETNEIQRVYWEDDNTWRISCDICYKYVMDKKIYYENELKSQSHIKKFSKIRLNNTNTNS